MKKLNKAISTLFTLFLLSNCSSENTINNISSENINALSRQEIGGEIYENFKINPKIEKSKQEKIATKLTYLMNDDEAHQSPWSAKMLLMMDDMPQTSVHNIVFRDGGKTDDSILYYLKGDNREKEIGADWSFLSDNVKEVQSNNPRLFSRIVEWTFDNYPSKRRYLQIYTHGGGAFGIGTDVHQTDLKGNELPKEQRIGMITPQKFSEALKQGLKGRKLDLIYFRACLMGNVEALYDLRGVVNYAIASEDVSYSKENSNIVMTKMFEDLSSKNTDPKDIAYQMAIQGHGKTGADDGYTTIAAFDLSKVDELKTALNQFALSLKETMSKESKAILDAYDAVPTIKGESIAEKKNENMRDLWRFTNELNQRVQSPSLLSSIETLRKAQKNFTLHSKDALGASANGLSIFMPFRTNLGEGEIRTFLTENYRKRKFAVDSAWDEFLISLPKA
ncbi:MAG: clostripain-related cysteine peptidase [Candidatus Sericytochromatia bacterium]